MNGYWQRDAPSKYVTLDKSNWFITNDLGYRDELGKMYFCGRASDTIRTGGETVMALEVERLLLRHSSIAEAAVFPLADDQYGEIVACALVAVGQNQTLNLGNLRGWLKEHGLSGYKCPKRIYYRQSLPRNTSGKVLKAVLRQQYTVSKQALQSKL